MSSWYHDSGAPTHCEYRLIPVRAFHAAVLRAYEGMRRSQSCVRVVLPQGIFGVLDPLREVWCCKVADNTLPRVNCQDREILLRIARPWLLGVDPGRHKGPWLSTCLIYSFIAGLTDEEVALGDYKCKASIGQKCTGTKANEAHQLLRELKQEVKKERKYYEEYEPMPEDATYD